MFIFRETLINDVVPVRYVFGGQGFPSVRHQIYVLSTHN